MRKRPSALTVTDQFCGAGGSSQGALEAGAEVRLALNHWDRACETYAANHKRDRVKQLGNAVTPPAMRLLLARVLASLEPEIAHHQNADMIA